MILAADEEAWFDRRRITAIAGPPSTGTSHAPPSPTARAPSAARHCAANTAPPGGRSAGEAHQAPRWGAAAAGIVGDQALIKAPQHPTYALLAR